MHEEYSKICQPLKNFAKRGQWKLFDLELYDVVHVHLRVYIICNITLLDGLYNSYIKST